VGKGGRWVGLTILPLSYAEYLEIWELQPPEILKACIEEEEEEEEEEEGEGGEEGGELLLLLLLLFHF
jgi:hypothetical protein